jgi:Rieske Fe-S protein
MSTRRGILLGAGVIALAGCSTKAIPYGASEAGSPDADAPDTGGAAPTPSASMMGTGTTTGTGTGTNTGAGTGTNTGAGTGTAQPATGTVLAATGDIPVGGGKIFAAEKVVVTQPVKGSYRAFSAVCTHVGCLVSEIADGTIDCPCHGSEFRITDGAVVTGPAPAPLPKKKIKIESGQVVLL